MATEAQPALYQMNEGTLPLDPAHAWEDHTLHVLRLPGNGHASASLVVTRELLPLGMDVDGYVAAELERLRGSLPEFSFVRTIPIAWADGPAEAVATRWRSNEGMVDQISACRRVAGRRVLIFTATHIAPMPAASFQALRNAIAGFVPRPTTQAQSAR